MKTTISVLVVVAAIIIILLVKRMGSIRNPPGNLDDLEDLIAFLSAEAVDIAHQNYGVSLDCGVESIERVEEVLSRCAKNRAQNAYSSSSPAMKPTPDHPQQRRVSLARRQFPKVDRGRESFRMLDSLGAWALGAVVLAVVAMGLYGLIAHFELVKSFWAAVILLVMLACMSLLRG